jgi:hypothetical protein
MIDLEYEMTFTERIEGPPGTTIGTAPRLCWQVTAAVLSGPRRRQAGIFGRYSQTTRRESRTAVLVKSRPVSG